MVCSVNDRTDRIERKQEENLGMSQKEGGENLMAKLLRYVAFSLLMGIGFFGCKKEAPPEAMTPPPEAMTAPMPTPTGEGATAPEPPAAPAEAK